MLKVFCAPARYVQGRDATQSLAAELKRLGLSGTALILASESPRRLLGEVWRETFPRSGFTFDVMPFGGECSRAEIARVAQNGRDIGAAVIIGVGGGKALDTARAVAAELDLPVACCPTTASSDAPCSALSVVYSADGVFETCLYYKRNPDLVLVDSTLVARAPVRLLIAGMGDALATYFEAKACMRAHKKNVAGGASTLAAAAISRLCYETLLADGALAVAAAKAGAITPALERIIEANTLLSGLGFESGGLSVAHSVHNGLTAAPQTHDRLHGEKVAFGVLVQLALEGAESAVMEEVLGFGRAVGLPQTLADLGLSELPRETARLIAARALAAGESAHNEPFEVTPDALIDALYAADAMGTAFKGR